MTGMFGRRTLLAMLGAAPAVLPGAVRAEGCTGTAEFDRLLEGLASAWNANDARRAADLFAEDAVYSEPPDRQLYRGREALFRFFGGPAGRAGRMQMTWHHKAFDAAGIGAGEFTFAWDGGQVHGMASIRVRNG